MKRVSPTGAVWSSQEIKKKLRVEMRRHLAETPNPYAIPLDVELGIVTER